MDTLNNDTVDKTVASLDVVLSDRRIHAEFKFNDKLNDHKNYAKYVILSPCRAHAVHF